MYWVIQMIGYNADTKDLKYDSDVESDKDVEKYYGGQGYIRLPDNTLVEDLSENGALYRVYRGSRLKHYEDGRVTVADDERYNNGNFEKRTTAFYRWLISWDRGDHRNVIAKPLYKGFVEYNPLAQGVTKLGSGVSGFDLTAPAWSDLGNTSGHVSGASLSWKRRGLLTAGGVTELASFYFGVGSGMSKWGLSYVNPLGSGIDVGLNFAADAVNTINTGQDNGSYLKYHAATVQLLFNRDVGGFLNSTINTAAGQLDNYVKEQEQQAGNKK